MAKNSKIAEEAQQEGQEVQAEIPATPVPETPKTTAEPAMPAVTLDTLKPTEDMENLTTLADRHRIASWQQAALMRHMGWEDGKMVSNADYESALQALKHRRMGGGRKE